MNYDQTSDSSWPPLLCRLCSQFYGDQGMDSLCSNCYKDFRSYHTINTLWLSKNKSQAFQKDPNQIRKGLLLYASMNYTGSRLRRQHTSVLRVTQTKQLRKDLLIPGFRKTLKYARRFKDLRVGYFDEDLGLPNHYYLSYQVISQLKAVRSLEILLVKGMRESIVKRLCSLVSKLNPISLKINFSIVVSVYYRHTTPYFNYIFLLIRKMRNLCYLGFRNTLNVHFGPDLESKLPRFRNTILNLPNLTEVSLGDYDGNQKLEVVEAFLNYRQLRKIQATVCLTRRKDTEVFLQNLGNVKELDYFQIDANYVEGNIVYHTVFFDFLRSLRLIKTMVFNDKSINFSLENAGSYTGKIENIINLVFLGFCFQSSIKLFQVTEGLGSIEINLKNSDKAILANVSKTLSKHTQLKGLRIKLDFSYSNLMDLLRNISLLNLKSFSLSLKNPDSISSIPIQQSRIEPVLLEFIQKQKELEEISIYLYFLINLKEFQSLMNKLSEFSTLKFINICLKLPKKLNVVDEEYKSNIRDFLNELESIERLKVELNSKGNVLVKILKT